MAFDLAICWIAALATVGVLAAMGMRNRRSGYRNERTDIPAEIVNLWAAVAAAEAQARNVVSREVPAQEKKQDQTVSDLMALGAFTGFAAPIIPIADQTSAVAEQDSAKLSADPVGTRQMR